MIRGGRRPNSHSSDPPETGNHGNGSAMGNCPIRVLYPDEAIGSDSRMLGDQDQDQDELRVVSAH